MSSARRHRMSPFAAFANLPTTLPVPSSTAEALRQRAAELREAASDYAPWISTLLHEIATELDAKADEYEARQAPR